MGVEDIILFSDTLRYRFRLYISCTISFGPVNTSPSLVTSPTLLVLLLSCFKPSFSFLFLPSLDTF
jgi:hypothetical protein